MLRLLLLSIGLLLLQSAYGQKNYFQQRVDYKLDLKLNDTLHELSGHVTIRYHNRSPDTLPFLYIHLWANAYRNDRTAFALQTLEAGMLDFYFSDEKDRGGISGLNFIQENKSITAVQTGNDDVVKLWLAHPVLPGRETIIQTPFRVKIPALFSRMGHLNQEYFLSQFYPKVALYDTEGWHPMPYLDMGEYFNDFGRYEADITLPQNYQVLGSGMGQTSVDTAGGEARNQYNRIKKTGNPAAWLRKPPASSGQWKTVHFFMDSATDFAFAASKWWLVKDKTFQQPGFQAIRILSGSYPWNTSRTKTPETLESALRYYQQQIGPYWQQSMAAVHCPVKPAMAGGMEYPGFTVLTFPAAQEPDALTIRHETGHNWFQGALSTNERRYPWMDEGMNSLYEHGYTDAGKRSLQSTTKYGIEEMLLHAAGVTKKLMPYDAPATTPPQLLNGLVAYREPVIILHRLMSIDTLLFGLNMKAYYRRNAGSHPGPESFFQAMDSGRPAGFTRNFFQKQDFVHATNRPRKMAVKAFWNVNEHQGDYTLRAGPALGYNLYDKLMIGVFATNYGLAMHKLEWLAAPLYSTGTGRLNGAARLAFNIYARKYWIQLSTSAITYHIASLPQPDDQVKLRMTRIVPAAQVRWYRNSLFQSHWTLQLKRFQIGEEQFLFSSSGAPASKTAAKQRYVHRASLGYQQNRALYPYEAKLVIDQGRNWARAGFTYEQFFNYNAKKEGLEFRFFAGKFLYLGPRSLLTEFTTLPYQLQLSGPRGGDDYTYSGYFAGRNKFEGAASQQMMKRDGFFKVSTDLLSDKTGRSDDWLTAINLNTTIPEKWNPLSVLPFKLPLKLFMDAGTYAEAWDENRMGQSRFLYDAGIQLSLLNNTVNVYVPLLSSKVFRDYNKQVLGSGSFTKTIAFSIDLERFQLQKISRNIPL